LKFFLNSINYSSKISITSTEIPGLQSSPGVGDAPLREKHREPSPSISKFEIFVTKVIMQEVFRT